MKNKLPLHVTTEEFEVRDNCLCIGGQTISDIWTKQRCAPFYAYDRKLIDRRIALLKSSLPAQIELHYAIKANPMPEVVQFIAPKVDGLDVASVGELRVALAAGTPNDRISFAGPGKTPEELQAAVDSNIVINVESSTELERILNICEKSARRANIALRINPEFELKTSGMKMSGGPKQFGIDAELAPEILMKIDRSQLNFVGFHIFTGSQSLNAGAICEAQNNAFELALRLSENAPAYPRLINIGGGFGIPYFSGDPKLELAEIANNLSELVRKIPLAWAETKLVLELGRYIVGEAGIYVCQVIDKKVSRGEIFLITDGGLNHHLAASGNFGQVIRKNYPVLIGNKVFSDDLCAQNVVGRLCTPLDVLANKLPMARGEIGDLVTVFQSGAYGYTASPTLFLGHPPPSEVLI